MARRALGGGAAVIRLDDLTIAYDGQAAVHRVSGAFATSSMTAIVGPNGAGKSTLIKALVGDKRAAGGRIDLGGLSHAAIGYLPQVAEIDRSFPLSVADTVLLGAWRQSGVFGRVSHAMREHGRAALAAVGLEGFEARPIGALSTGQFRRVLFARLLLQDAEVIMLDEPFASVDTRTTDDLLRLIDRWHGEGRTIIAVLHDLEQVRGHFPQTLLLAREIVAWGDTRLALSPENLSRASVMSEAWDSADESVGTQLKHVA